MRRDEPARGFLAQAAIGRATLLELVLLAVLVGLGVNLIAASLPGVTGLGSGATVILGAVVCLLSMSYLAARLLGPMSHVRRLDGFLVYDPKANELVTVPRYGPAEEAVEYMAAAFAENPALKAQWDKEPLRDLHSDGSWDKRRERARRSMSLVSEVLEYYILEMLSTHLTDYFGQRGFGERNLKEYTRADVPDVLLTNRFLELFSRPMEERAPFGERADRDELQIVRVNSDGESTVVRSIVRRGAERSKALYERFDLVLPKNSRVRRLGERCVQIDTARLIIRLEIRFDGYHTVLPRGFGRRYLARDARDNTWALAFGVDVSVSLKWRALVPGMGWEYHRWVDSFLDKLWREVDKDYYFESIAWSSAVTVLESLERTADRRDSAGASPAAPSSPPDGRPPGGAE